MNLSHQTERYLHLLNQQYTANLLGLGSTWIEGVTEMDTLWNGFTDDEREIIETEWQARKNALESHTPPAPDDLGMVDRTAGNGVSPRCKVPLGDDRVEP